MLAAIVLPVISGVSTRIYFVRHGERRDTSPDSPLSDKGHERAKALRDQLRKEDIDIIFATEYVRAQQTAIPLAEAIGKEVRTYRTGDSFTQSLRKLGDKTVVVIGHSNTLPSIIRKLTGENIDIPEEVFNNLFIVTITDGKAVLKKEIYGN